MSEQVSPAMGATKLTNRPRNADMGSDSSIAPIEIQPQHPTAQNEMIPRIIPAIASGLLDGLGAALVGEGKVVTGA